MEPLMTPESTDAIHKAKNAAHALEIAREAQNAKLLSSVGDELQTRLEDVLARGTEQDKSIVLARVPYICQDIKGINISLTEIKGMFEQVKRDLDAREEKNDRRYVNQDQFTPVQRLVYGVVGLILTAVVVALIALITK